jgi:predicted AAA+ superfamily ATPase
MKDVIDFLIDDFHERALPELLCRESSMPRLAGKANVVVGMRRSGKTWFCYQQMRELGSGRGTIVTWLDEETSGSGIDVVPVWKWLLRTPGSASEERKEKKKPRPNTKAPQ